MNCQKSSFWLTSLLLLLGFAFAVNYGYYTKASADERGNISVAVSPGKLNQSAPLLLDRAKQGQPKQWAQPDKILARYTIKNQSRQPLPVTVLASRFTVPVTLQSGAATFEKPTGQISRLIPPGQALRVNVSLNLSNVTARPQPLGQLQAIDTPSGAILAITPVHLATAQPEQPAAQDTPHEQHHGGGK